MNFASLKNVLGQVAQSAADLGQQVSTQAMQLIGAKNLRDYIVDKQTGTGGFGSGWKIYSAHARKEGAPFPTVSVWIFEKRVGVNGDYLQAGDTAQVIEHAKRECAALAKLKHSTILTVVEPMEETRNQLVMVTEPVFGSVRDILNHFKNLPPALADERKDLRLSRLELKSGLLQVADALHNLHMGASMVHRGLCPESVVITSSGQWKLVGLGLAAPIQLSATPGGASPIFLPSIEGSWPARLQFLQPELSYMAPELVSADPASTTPPVDIFPFGALVYEVVTGRQLLQVSSSISEYRGKLAALHMMDLSPVPPSLHNMLRSMLSSVAATRPPASAFSGAQFFQEDKVVKAVRLLETLSTRTSEQKALLLMDLGTPDIWGGLDARILRLRVLPALLGEARNVPLQPLSLPLVLRILSIHPLPDPEGVAPLIAPVLATAHGEALLILLRGMAALTSVLSNAATEQLLLPLFVRAAESGDPRLQEEMLAQLPTAAKKCSPGALEAEVLPAIQKLCLATTVAAVRCRMFQTLALMIDNIQQIHCLQALHTLRQVTSVDHSGTTISAGVQMAEVFGSKHPNLLATAVLPSLLPLLGAPLLDPALFRKIIRYVRQGLTRLEKERDLPPTSDQEEMPSSSVQNPKETLPSSSATSAAVWKNNQATSLDVPLYKSLPTLAPLAPPPLARPQATGVGASGGSLQAAAMHATPALQGMAQPALTDPFGQGSSFLTALPVQTAGPGSVSSAKLQTFGTSLASPDGWGSLGNTGVPQMSANVDPGASFKPSWAPSGISSGTSGAKNGLGLFEGISGVGPEDFGGFQSLNLVGGPARPEGGSGQAASVAPGALDPFSFGGIVKAGPSGESASFGHAGVPAAQLDPFDFGPLQGTPSSRGDSLI